MSTEHNHSVSDQYFNQIAKLVTHPINLMEVCGTHTVAISRFGIRSRLPRDLRLLSGPGCPVCVTPTAIIDTIIELSRLPDVIIATFGDMLRVPGTASSLQQERASGKSIKIIYSPLEAIELAQQQPSKTIVLVAVGFETTLPVLAATMIRAKEMKLENFFAIPSGRLAPPAMAALLQSNDVKIDGFICPGHVSTIIGSAPYLPLARDYHVPCVVTGFEANDILQGVVQLLEQIADNRTEVEIQYKRAVSDSGNKIAQDAIARVFQIVDAEWRGIGVIPLSGMEFNEEFHYFDARQRFSITTSTTSAMPAGCRCGEIMRGMKLPPECELFGRSCTPQHAVGPCMVSSEGCCAAYYRYGST